MTSEVMESYRNLVKDLWEFSGALRISIISSTAEYKFISTGLDAKLFLKYNLM